VKSPANILIMSINPYKLRKNNYYIKLTSRHSSECNSHVSSVESVTSVFTMPDVKFWNDFGHNSAILEIISKAAC
jgi:hypothetical protein